MTVKDFMFQFNNIHMLFKSQMLYKRYIELYPLFEDYEREALGDDKLKEAEIRFYDMFCGLIGMMEDTEVHESSYVLFVTRLVGLSFEDGETLDSFYCIREDIEEKLSFGDYPSICYGGNMVERYAYNMSEIPDILSMEIYVYDVPPMDAVCEIIHTLSFFGMEEESRSRKINEVSKSLKKSMDEIDSGKEEGIPAEEVIASLEKELMEHMSNDEKEQFLLEKAEKEKNKDRDFCYMVAAGNQNHLQRVSAITDYYRHLLLEGRFIPIRSDDAEKENRVSFSINNCCDCPFSHEERVYTPDPFEHEFGVYCTKVPDSSSYNGKYKLVVADEDVREWAKIPNWCPLLKK